MINELAALHRLVCGEQLLSFMKTTDGKIKRQTMDIYWFIMILRKEHGTYF